MESDADSNIATETAMTGSRARLANLALRSARPMCFGVPNGNTDFEIGTNLSNEYHISFSQSPVTSLSLLDFASRT
jgi:hypothetical protein